VNSYGGHLAEYFKKVDELLEEVYQAHSKGDLTDDQAAAAIRGIQKTLRDQLKDGSLKLHNEAGLMEKYAGVMLAFAGMPKEDQEELVEKDVAEATARIEAKLEQFTIFHIGRVGAYTGKDGICGWIGWGIDLFNPMDDVAMIGDLLNVVDLVLEEMYPREIKPIDTAPPKAGWVEEGPTGRVWRVPGQAGGIPE
jgi:hypothetical protein